MMHLLLYLSPLSLNFVVVVQIIKSRSAKQKVGIRLEGKGRKDFVFNDNKVSVLCRLCIHAGLLYYVCIKLYKVS